MPMTEKPQHLSFEENLRWLLEPQAELDRRLFGADDQLLLPAQKQLLCRINLFIETCIKPFPGFTVKDIVMCGSADSYHYHQFSDIDITVLVAYDASVGIFAGKQQAYKFLCRYVDAYYKKHRPFVWDGRILDIRTALYLRQRQLYSVLHRTWITKASREVMKNVMPEEVLAEVRDVLRQMKSMREEQFERSNGKYKISDINKMEKFYNHLIYLKTTSATQLLVTKLLNYSGDMHRFKKFCRAELVKALSF